MRVTNLLLFCSILSLSTVGIATTSFRSAAPDCAAECTAAPVAVNPTDGFPLTLAKSLLQNGVEPNLQQLVGNWKLVGVANVPGNPGQTEQAGWLPDNYNPQGLKNSDDSVEAELTILSGQNTGKTNFAGQPLVTVPNVTISGMGNSTQGPFELTVDTTKEFAALFARYAYSSFDNTKMRSYFNYECRLLTSDVTKMVCSETFVLAPSEKNNSSVADRKWNGQVWQYLAYEKAAD